MRSMRGDELNRMACGWMDRGEIAAVEMRGERNGKCNYIRNV